jgi:hypothetical protein
VVAVDATSVNLTDLKLKKQLGSVGSISKGSQGFHAMTALAVTPSGLPLGITGQKLWVRGERSKRRDDGKPDAGGETLHWLAAMDATREAIAAGGAQTVPFFQLDRGADCWQVLEYGEEEDVMLTVRAAHDRCVDGQLEHLWTLVEQSPVRARRTVAVPARRPRAFLKRVGKRRRETRYTSARDARTANLQIRAMEVALRVTTTSGRNVVQYNVVHAKERVRRDGLEWLLLTRHPIKTKNQILAVIDSYALRWRVEDFHRAWKRGHCNVERTQLRSARVIFKWATLLATVATRAMRLAHQARKTPDAAASSEFSEAELRALLALRKIADLKTSDISLEQAVRWTAELGGYTGPWNGPPGATTLGRGLRDVTTAARVLEFLHQKR